MFINKETEGQKSCDNVPLRGPFTPEAVENKQKHDHKQLVAPSFFVNRRKRHKTALKVLSSEF